MKKSKRTQIDGEIYHVHGLEKSIYSIPIKLPMYFSQNQNKEFHNLYGNTKKTSNRQGSLEKEEWNWRNQSA